MTLNEYENLATRTAKVMPTFLWDLNHAALGMSTETGEFGTIVKRCLIYDKEFTPEMREHAVEELGDALWYIALAARTLDVPLGEIARRNIDKLALRYPEKYSDAAAEARADKGGADARSS